MEARPATRTAALARSGRNRSLGVVGLVAVMATGLMLAGCNTTAGVGRDVSATGQAVTRGANDVKSGL